MSVISLCDPVQFSLQDVDVQWKHLQLRVIHRSSKHTLFSTSGIFICATTSQAVFEESRGFFHIKEKPKSYSKQQRILSITEIEFEEQIHAKKIRVQGDFGEKTQQWLLEIWKDEEDFLRMHVQCTDANRLQIVFNSPSSERIMGFGEQLTYCNLKGHRISILSQEPGIGRGIQPLTWLLNKSFGAGGSVTQSSSPAPLFVSTENRGFLCENYEYSIFDLTNPQKISYEIYTSHMKIRLWCSKKPLQLIEQLTKYTGRMPVPPRWVDQGAIIGLQGGTKRVQDFWNKLKEYHTPIAAFWLQDWIGQRKTSIGKQLWWNWELDEEHYPNWKQLIETFKDDHIVVLGYINPFLIDPKEKGTCKRNLYAEAESQGFFVQHPKGGTYLIQNTSFSAGLIDLSNPKAYHWIKDVIKTEMINIGLRGWMADFAEALPFDAVLYDGDPTIWHNYYPEVWSKLNREIIDEMEEEREFLFFNRAGFTKSPKYSTLYWMGDQLTSWRREDGIKSAVVGLITSGLSGISINHGDIGGYIATTAPNFPIQIPNLAFARNKEILMRWIEFSAFTAVFRTHEGNQPKNHVQIDFDDETLAHFALYAKIYVALSRYRRSLFEEAQQYGYPLTRHLWLHYPEDPNVLDIDLQYLFGRDILVAPVLDAQKHTQHVYLPKDTWIHLWSQKNIVSSGEEIQISCPVGQIPIFVRKNTRVWDELQFVIST